MASETLAYRCRKCGTCSRLRIRDTDGTLVHDVRGRMTWERGSQADLGTA
jgi:hypothetical protein